MDRPFRRHLLVGTLMASAVLRTSATPAQQPKGADAPAQVQQKKANAAAPRLAVAPDPRRMRQILKDWERLSSQLKTVQVKIRRYDTSAVFGDETFVGDARLQAPNLGFLDFQKEVKNPKTKKS